MKKITKYIPISKDIKLSDLPLDNCLFSDDNDFKAGLARGKWEMTQKKNKEKELLKKRLKKIVQGSDV